MMGDEDRHSRAWEVLVMDQVKRCYDNIKLSDVMVHTHGRMIAINSVIVGAQSAILSDILKSKDRSTALEDIFEPYETSSVDLFLRCLYGGAIPGESGVEGSLRTCTCSQDGAARQYSRVLDVYQLALTLDVLWLVAESRSWLMDNLGCDTVFPTLSVVLSYGDRILTYAANAIFSRNRLDDVLSREEWCATSCDLVIHVLSLPGLLFDTEVDVFRMALSWIEQNISISRRDHCVEVMKCVQVSSLPNRFKEHFVYPYTSVLSQKLFLALKYPQMNRWKLGPPIKRANLTVSMATLYSEFSLYIDRNTIFGSEKQKHTYFHGGCHVTLRVSSSFTTTLEIMVESDKRFGTCYLWIRTLQEPGLFPLGWKSISVTRATVAPLGGVIVRWPALDFVELQRLFSNGGRVQIGFTLYRNNPTTLSTR